METLPYRKYTFINNVAIRMIFCIQTKRAHIKYILFSLVCSITPDSNCHLTKKLDDRQP